MNFLSHAVQLMKGDPLLPSLLPIGPSGHLRSLLDVDDPLDTDCAAVGGCFDPARVVIGGAIFSLFVCVGGLL